MMYRRLRLLVALPFALALAFWQSAEYWHVLGAAGAPLVEGDVIHREEMRIYGGIPAGRLMIQLPGTDTVVQAVTTKDAMRQLPERVRFHYTGDPKREVFVEGESNPLWGALILWTMSIGIVIFCLYPWLRRRPANPAAPVPTSESANHA